MPFEQVARFEDKNDLLNTIIIWLFGASVYLELFKVKERTKLGISKNQKVKLCIKNTNLRVHNTSQALRG